VTLTAGYGLVLGVIRLKAGGLLAPWLAHVLADVTIVAMVASYAAVSPKPDAATQRHNRQRVRAQPNQAAAPPIEELLLEQSSTAVCATGCDRVTPIWRI
jgi:hypothetical protein